jgi:hypothetical protein
MIMAVFAKGRKGEGRKGGHPDSGEERRGRAKGRKGGRFYSHLKETKKGREGKGRGGKGRKGKGGKGRGGKGRGGRKGR